jgi:outer membrane lipoprotein-sorting protein
MHSLLAGILLTCAAGAQAAPLSLSQLMATLAAHPQHAATFSETKYIAVLDQPVQSSGELRFIPPSRLEMRTLKPRAETLVLDGEQLSVERGQRRHVLQTRDNPEVAGMVESIRATLSGDRKALERVYHVSLTGSAARWALSLVPLDVRVARLVARIRIEGSEARVTGVEILQSDGDRAVMRIQGIDAGGTARQTGTP